jgi:opacity protein-like surface antigen
VQTIKSKKIIFQTIVFLFSPTLFASTGHIYLAGSAGASWANFENSNPKIHYYDGLLSDAYPVDKNHETAAVFSVNGGYEFEGSCLIPAIALGLGLYGTDNYEYEGQLIETAAGGSSSTLYNYKFNLKSQRLMAEAQFTWLFANKLAPFINVGVGSAWNRMSDYTETSVNSTGYVTLPSFESHTNTNFAYQVGLGMGYAFNFSKDQSHYQHERISFGYRYVNLGDASFDTRGVDYPYNLDFGHIETNEIYLSYTHLF